jgi:hypothetical protein
VRWVRQIKGAGDEQVRAIAVTPGGDIKITGYYTIGATWDTLSATGPGMFLLTIDPNGTLLTAQTAATDISILPSNLVLANDGTALVSGRFTGTALGRTSTSTANPDAFLAAFGSSGNFQWSFAGGGSTATDDGVGLSVASDGSIILGCLFNGAVNFNGVTTNSTKGTWLGQFTTAGTVLSFRYIDGISVTALAAGKHGIVHVIGTFSANFTLDGVAMTANGTSIGIASFLISGWELEGVSTVSSSPAAFAHKAATTPDDGLAVVGFGQQSLTVDGASVATTLATGLNGLVLRLTPPEYKLTIAPQGANLQFTFPGYYYDATLQTNSALPGTWGDFPATIVKSPGLRTITVSTNSSRLFYRLKR